MSALDIAPSQTRPGSTDAQTSGMAASASAPERAEGTHGAIDHSEPPVGRRERRKLEMRAKILDAARTLFTERGFQATTVDEIARLADVAPATFFNHFQSKSALLELMTGEVVEYLHALTTQHLEGPGLPTEKLRGFTASVTESIRASRGVARDVLLEFVRKDATPSGPHPYLHRITDPFVALVAEGQALGEMRDDYEPEFLAQMAVGMLNSAITNWLADPAYPVEEGLVAATEFILNTFRAEASQPSEIDSNTDS